ncbi:MAG: LppA family lipoprotein [Mycobacteriaceae bacterium]
MSTRHCTGTVFSRIVVVFLSFLFLLGLGACTKVDYWEQKQRERNEANQQLMDRPTLEDTVARLTQMQEDIITALSTAIPTIAWKPYREPGGAGCDQPLTISDGHSRTLTGWSIEGGISDADWPQALDIVTRIARSYGFAEPGFYVDKPGRHDARYQDDLGNYFSFGTYLNASIAIGTGCFLPQADKTRISTDPSPTSYRERGFTETTPTPTQP